MNQLRHPFRKLLKNSGSTAVALLLLALGSWLTGCALPPRLDGNNGNSEATRLISLDDTLQPLVHQFNADKEKPRILALFSPT